MKREPRFGSAINNEDIVAIIPLTRNQHTIIDPIDLGKIDEQNWTAKKRRTKYMPLFDACRNVYLEYKNKKSISKCVYLHRLIMDAPSGLDVDHINGNPLDNRKSNLRTVTRRENTQNKHIKKSSKYPGVSWDKTNKKWQASIHFNGTPTHLGRYVHELDAALAYKNAILEMEGII